jgi:Fic family protein
MMSVREQGEYEQWVRFFLTAILESANDAIETIDKLVSLHDRNSSLIQNTGRSAKTIKKVFEYLEKNPIIEIQRTAKALKMSFITISNAINQLCDTGILKQTADNRRNRTFFYEEYLNILRNGT